MSYQFVNQPAAVNQASTFGFSPNTAALFSYIWIPVTSILVLVTEKQNRLVRFHAWQSPFLGLSFFLTTIVLSVVIGVIMLVSAAVSVYAGIFVSVISLLIWLVVSTVFIGVWVWCLIKAYRGEKYKLLLIGKFAEKMINK